MRIRIQKISILFLSKSKLHLLLILNDPNPDPKKGLFFKFSNVIK